MIEKLGIKNFKSVKDIELQCKKINIFIGEPNTGKSNILESLGLLSYLGYGGEFNKYVRYENISNLYFDHNLVEDIEIHANKAIFKLAFRNDLFRGFFMSDSNEREICRFDYNGSTFHVRAIEYSSFKFYRFTVKNVFTDKTSNFLSPPEGDNLVTLLLTYKESRALVSTILKRSGYTPVIKPVEKTIEFQKMLEEDVAISFPVSLISETLYRTMLHILAISSNKDAIIAFEEPEAHAFPYHTKYLAERIALNKNDNQYFISTHNPYFLLAILEKSRAEDVGVSITFTEKYQTKVKQLSNLEIQKILDLGPDVFLSIEELL